MEDRLKKLDSLLEKYISWERRRKENMQKLRKLYFDLKIDKKVPRFEELFEFNAINLMGITLQKGEVGIIQPKKYVQIIGIKNSKNMSLAYFGRAENLDEKKRDKIAKFVLMWRYEKGFRGLQHYEELLKELNETEVEQKISK